MNLYAMTKEMKAIQEAIENATNYETGELNVSDEILEAEDITRENISNKIDSYIKVMRNIDSQVSVIDAELERLNDLKKSKKKEIENMKKFMMMCMDILGEKKIEATLGKVTKVSKKTLKIDAELLDEKYIKNVEVIKTKKYTVDKDLVKVDLKDKPINGAYYGVSEYIMIK